jgi:uncharacterized protein YecT (DUF1311 family)
MAPADIFALASLIVSVLTLFVIILDFFGFKERVREYQKVGIFAAVLMVWAIYYLVQSRLDEVRISVKAGPNPSPTATLTPTPIVPTALIVPTPLPTPALQSLANEPPSQPNPAAKPSFPCWKASTAVEITLCQTPGLAEEEQEMSTAYGEVLHALSGAEQRSFRLEHLYWFKRYSNECNSLQGSEKDLRECISRYLTSHTAVLRERLARLR